MPCLSNLALSAALALGMLAPIGHAHAAEPQLVAAQLADPFSGADRAGPWGNSSYEFARRISTSVYKTVNLQREKKGLEPFTPDAGLGSVAGGYAADMITGDFFGHFAPDGRDLGTRLSSAGVAQDYAQVAEVLWDMSDDNISWLLENTVRSAVTEWLNSDEGHREALLDPKLRLAGVGTALREGRIVVAMLLGRR